MKLATIFLAVALAMFSVLFWSQYQRAQKDLHTERTMKVKLADQLALLQERFSDQQIQLAALAQKTESQEKLVHDMRRAQEITHANLEKSKEELVEARRQAQTAQALLDEQAGRIADLENQRGDLSRDMSDLTASLKMLNSQIDETQLKLANATGDRDFLLAELKRLQREKNMVLRQFNDMEMLRAQLARLREETVINRRLNWIRRGIYSRHSLKGAELLVAKEPLALPEENRDIPRLEVEFNQQGEIRVVPETPALSPTQP